MAIKIFIIGIGIAIHIAIAILEYIILNRFPIKNFPISVFHISQIIIIIMITPMFLCTFLSFNLFLARQKRTEYNNPVVCFLADAWIRWCVSLQENTTCFNPLQRYLLFAVQGSSLLFRCLHEAVCLKMPLKYFAFRFSPSCFRKIKKISLCSIFL